MNFIWTPGTFLYKKLYSAPSLIPVDIFQIYIIIRCEMRIQLSMPTHQGKETSGYKAVL